MGKKVSKSNTPVWVWVIIFIILLQIAKFAHRNNWFLNKKPNNTFNEKIFRKDVPKYEEMKEILEELKKKELIEKNK